MKDLLRVVETYPPAQILRLLATNRREDARRMRVMDVTDPQIPIAMRDADKIMKLARELSQ
jgi:hypothetical protein